MTPPVLNNDKRLFKLGGVIQIAATSPNAGNRYLKDTTSFGVQPMILHSFSKVSMVMFPPFLRESSV